MRDGVVPDVRDGLTPVCRRALLVLHAARARGPAYRSSARAVDDVLRAGRVDGGRRAIYAELLRMAREHELRHPLVDGQGDLGYIDGERAASADDTELRLGPVGGELLRAIGAGASEDDGVGAREDDDGARRNGRGPDPRVLPARLPNLLVNGSFSVATGDAAWIPPHNLREVVAATVALVEDPQVDTAELMRHLPGPDFPTGAIVAGDGLRAAYQRGSGTIVVRARTHVETGPRCDAIVVTELPHMVTTGGRQGVVADIRRGMRGRRIAGIAAILDESSERDGLRIVLELRREATPDAVLEQLLAQTRLRRELALDIVAAVGGERRRMGLREAIAHYVEHRRAVVAAASGLRSPERVLGLVADDLRAVAERHGDARRSEIA